MISLRLVAFPQRGLPRPPSARAAFQRYLAGTASGPWPRRWPVTAVRQHAGLRSTADFGGIGSRAPRGHEPYLPRPRYYGGTSFAARATVTSRREDRDHAHGGARR